MKKKQPSLKSLNVNLEPISEVALRKHLNRERVVNQIIDKYVDEFISSLSKHDLDSEYKLILKSIRSYCQKAIKEKVDADKELNKTIDDSLLVKEPESHEIYRKLIANIIKQKSEEFLLVGKLTSLYLSNNIELSREKIDSLLKARFENESTIKDLSLGLKRLNVEKVLLHERAEKAEAPDKRKTKHDVDRYIREFFKLHPQLQNKTQEEIASICREWIIENKGKDYSKKYLRPRMSYKK